MAPRVCAASRPWLIELRRDVGGGVEMERLENQKTLVDVAGADEVPADGRLRQVVNLLADSQ